MAAVEAEFEESFSGFKWYQFGECLCQKEVMKKTVIFYLLWKVIDFLLLTFAFDSRHGSTESFIWLVSRLKARSGLEAERCANQLSNDSEN